MCKLRPVPYLLAAFVLALLGCQQGAFRADFFPEFTQDAHTPTAKSQKDNLQIQRAGLKVDEGDKPAMPLPEIKSISTVTAPEASKRFISLAECIALALENGRTGEFLDQSGSQRQTSVTGLNRLTPPSSSTDSIRVFAFDPAILATEIEESLSRFDTLWLSNLLWNRTDKPSPILTANPSALEEFTVKNKLDAVGFRTGLVKPLATGGVAGITVSSDYNFQYFLPGSDFVNPAYRPMLAFSFEQPLLQGAGVPINQIRDSHPGSILNPLPPGGRAAGILLARVSFNQSRLEFERRIQELLFKVEEAYWGLYSAYWELYSRENGLKQAHAAWQIAKARFDAGGIGIEDVAMVEEQYQSFRQQRLAALGDGVPGRPGVLEAERRLRYVIGLAPEDGNRLIPGDSPTLAPLEPNWDAAWMDARQFRPEIRQIQEDIQAAQLDILKAKDLLRPDLRFVSKYDVNGLGNTLGASFHQGRSEWELGLQMQAPIGFRQANSQFARAKYQLAQRMAYLEDQEAKLVFSLQRSYRDLIQYREEMRIRASQRQAAATQLKARQEKFKAGGDPKNPDAAINLLLIAQRKWADSVRDEYTAVCNYNVAMADFERQKGTIMPYRNVALAEGYLPQCALGQASNHIRQWNATEGVPYSPAVETGVSSMCVPKREFGNEKKFGNERDSHRPGSLPGSVIFATLDFSPDLAVDVGKTKP